MTGGHGGRRLRSGRKPDPLSARSLERRGALIELPEDGYDGPVPSFPLPSPSERELVVWSEAWTTPQAAVWAAEPWRQRTAALWTRWSVRAEDVDATAATGAVTLRLAAELGLTPAGMTEQGWTIGPPPDRTGRREWVRAGDRRPRPGVPSVRDRLNGVDDGRVSSLERARRRSQHWDPRSALTDEWTPPDAG